MTGAPFLLLLAVLQQQPEASSTVEELPPEDSSYPAPAPAPAPGEGPGTGGSGGGEGVGFHASLDVGAQVLPSGTRGGQLDGFAYALPQLGVDGGEDFEFVLGAPLRFRLVDGEPLQTATDHGARLRREDWDERSDFGQLLRRLRIGEQENMLQLEVGPFVEQTLGYGHLVGRYTNVLNPDYHPAGATLQARLGATQVEVLASDVLAARLFAGEVRMDIGRLSSTDEKHFDRYHVGLSVAHDFGRAGGSSEPITAVQLGGDVALHKGEKAQVFVLASGGARADVGELPVPGGLLGLAIRGQPTPDLDISGRLEGRYHGGGFRFGLFGASYELARFSSTGLSEPPLSAGDMPRDISGFGEVALQMGAEDTESARVVASAAGEYFLTGRLDADLALTFQLPGGKAGGSARVILTDVMRKPRYAGSLTGTYRVMPALYVWAGGGTVHFAQADGSLVRGITASAGVGVDFDR